MYEEDASFELPDLDDPRDFIFVVHFRSLKQDRRAVFYATDEDSALRFCIHYSTVEKYSRELWWNLLVYRELANDVYRRESSFVCGVTQDGLPVDAPPSFEPGSEPLPSATEAADAQFGDLLRQAWQRRLESRVYRRREDD